MPETIDLVLEAYKRGRVDLLRQMSQQVEGNRLAVENPQSVLNFLYGWRDKVEYGYREA